MKYEAKLTELKGEIDNFTIILQNLSTPFMIMDRMRQKIRK